MSGTCREVVEVTESSAMIVVPSPLGPITVVASAAGVRHLVLPGLPSPTAGDDASATCADAMDICRRARSELVEYFRGERTRFEVDVDLRGTGFQTAAWAALRAIPFGTTVSYGDQARMMGRPGSARAVGAANGRNPVPIIVPCHRVLGADGSLVGYAARTLGPAGLTMKSWLIVHEREVLAAADSTRGRIPLSAGTVTP